MIYNLAILSPCVVSILWLLFYLLAKGKDRLQRVWIILLLVASVSFTCDASLMSVVHNYEMYPVLDVLISLFAPSLPVISFMFVQLLRCEKFHSSYYLFLILPVSLCSIVAILYLSMGYDDAMKYVGSSLYPNVTFVTDPDRLFQLQHLFSERVYRIVLIVETVALISYLVRLMVIDKFKIGRFLKSAVVSEVMIEDIVQVIMFILFSFFLVKIVLRAFFPSDYLVMNACVSVVETVIMVVLCHVVVYTKRGSISLSDIRNTVMNVEPETEPQGRSVSSGLNEEVSISNYDRFLKDFERIIINEERFLDPKLTVDSLAKELRTNRTYLSRLVNRRFKVSFREYINNKRIEHAKMLMKNNPSALMENIAKSSGFMTTSQFNRKFKELEGQSPRIWQISNVLTQKS